LTNLFKSTEEFVEDLENMNGDNEEVEPRTKRFRSDNKDVDLRFSNNSQAAGNIPSLLHINVNDPNNDKNEEPSQNSPQAQNGSASNNQKGKTRRQGSRWSSRR
jgi:hypothetical protein